MAGRTNKDILLEVITKLAKIETHVKIQWWALSVILIAIIGTLFKDLIVKGVL